MSRPTSTLLNESLLLEVIENLPAGVFAKDASDDYRFVIWNKEMERIFANDRSEMLGKNDYDFFGKEEADYYRRCDIEVVENQRIIDIPSEVVTTKAGKIIAHTIKVPTKLPDGRLLLLGILEDITQLHEAKKQIEHYQKHLEELVEKRTKELEVLASTDMLTQLANRQSFVNTVESLISDEQAEPFTLVYLDLDRFKLLNDTYGHDLGDELLTAVGKRLASLAEHFQVIGRIGGDEFALVIPSDILSLHVDQICQLIAHSFSEPFELKNRHYFIGCSIGLSGYPHDAKTFKQLLQHADTAMYHVKHNRHKQCWQRYTIQMESTAHLELQIEQNIKNGLKNKEFSIVYQPQFCAKEIHKIVGVEALIRWSSPLLGHISPAVFIPVAEMCGLIHDVTEFVLTQVCRDIQALQHQGIRLPSVSVNLSVKDLDIGLPARIEAILDQYGVGFDQVCLEITESIKWDGKYDFTHIIQPLRDRGMRVSIDDFGTGYSSLSYFSMISVDEVKIDRLFVQMSEDRHASVIQAVIGIGQAFGFESVAEGVETSDQLEFLVECGIDRLQGFFLSKPLGLDQLLTLLHKTGD